MSAARPASRAWTRAGAAVLVVVVIAAVWSLDADWSALRDFLPNLGHYLALMFGPPDWSKTGQALTSTLLSIEMAWIGSILGIIVSFPLSFLATAGIVPAWIRLPVRLVFAVLRAVPEVVIAILILSVTGLTPFTGALALGIGSIGTLGKWGYEAFETVAPGPGEAVRAVGGGLLARVRWGVWPLASPQVLSFWLYRFEISVRASAILGLIGAGGIGKMLSDNVQYRIWDSVGTLLIVVVVVTMVIDQISGAVRSRIITGRWRLVGYGARRRALRPGASAADGPTPGGDTGADAEQPDSESTV